MLDYEQRQGCTTLVDGLGPDGNRDVYNPQNDITCDSDGDGVLDGNRLFSRPPLVIQLKVRRAHYRKWGWTQKLWVIVNHWKSKGDDTPEVEYTLPRRIEQAQFVAGLAQEILAADPGADLIVLGDMNDFLDSQPLAVLTDARLSDLLLEVPKPQRYTYIYQGESEVLDHVLISPDLWDEFVTVALAHINADYPNTYEYTSDIARRSSDHDPVLVRFRLDRYPAAPSKAGLRSSAHWSLSRRQRGVPPEGDASSREVHGGHGCPNRSGSNSAVHWRCWPLISYSPLPRRTATPVPSAHNPTS